MKRNSLFTTTLGIGLSALLLGLAPSAQAVTNIDLYNTGMSTPWYSGAPSAIADGVNDPFWTIVSMPDTSSASAITASANAAWLANNTTSKWINDNGNGGSNSPFGTYVYRTSFNLPVEADLSTVVVVLRMSQDNTFTSLKLNNANTGFNNPATFNGWSSSAVLTTGFQTGANNLDFTFVNASSTNNPQGLRVEFLTATFGAPEPGTLALLALGSLALLKRRKH
jgi:PEP-CTERM motif